MGFFSLSLLLPLLGWLPCFRMWLYLTNSATSFDEPILFFSRVSHYISFLERSLVERGEGVNLPLSESLCVFVFSFSVDILEQ